MDHEQARSGQGYLRGVLAGACGLLLLAAVVVNQSAVHWRENTADSCNYAFGGWRIANGATPYIDVWNNKPPGIYWVNALAYLICGPGTARDVLFSSVALLAALLGFVALARRAYHPSLLLPAVIVGGLVLTHQRYECGANRTETFVAACEILTILAYLRWVTGRRFRWLALAGLVAGAAPLFKQSGLGAAGACGLHLLWLQLRARRAATPPDAPGGLWKQWAVAGGGFVMLPLLAAALLAAQGALGEAWFAVVTFNRAYFEVHDATFFRVGGALGVYRPTLEPLTPLLILAGTGLVLGLHRWGRAGVSAVAGRHDVGLFVLWLLLSLYLVCIVPGRQAYHLAPLLPPLGLLALYPLDFLAGQHGLFQRLTRRGWATLALVIYAYLLCGVAADSGAIVLQRWQKKPHWYALHLRDPTGDQRRAAEIIRLTAPTDTIYVWGWSPGTYRYAYRACPSRFATIEKVGHVGERARFIADGALADIRRSPPKAVVIPPRDVEWMLSGPRREFALWLVENYERATSVDGMDILLRKN
ncbi:MAG: glycosyltransferase family 39 protein [Planctomycetes bacterium]|nr:glycosyltransferase family 39 protein [Planctomycetota bacterium]